MLKKLKLLQGSATKKLSLIDLMENNHTFRAYKEQITSLGTEVGLIDVKKQKKEKSKKQE
jgi:hypothetical protein